MAQIFPIDILPYIQLANVRPTWDVGPIEIEWVLTWDRRATCDRRATVRPCVLATDVVGYRDRGTVGPIFQSDLGSS